MPEQPALAGPTPPRKFEPDSVSVIIPVYNGEAYLRETVESVLAQSRRPSEIVIVDDGSTDGTKAVAAALKGNIRYFHQRNSGPPAARNAGVRAARGELIGFIDADDLWAVDKIEIQSNMLLADPSIDLAVGYTQVVKAVADAEGVSTLQPITAPGPATTLGGALIRRKAFEIIGLFSESQRYADDVDWFLRAKEAGLSIIFHADVVHFYRRHSSNISNDIAMNNKYLVLAIKKSLERRRKASGGAVRPLSNWIGGKER